MATDLVADIGPTELLTQITAISRLRAVKDDAGMALAQAFKKAKADGAHLDALKMAIKIKRMDPDDAAQLLRQTIRYLRVMGSAAVNQLDLFAAPVDVEPEAADEFALAEVEAAGFAAGKKGEMGQRDHRWPVASSEAQAWERGWLRGQSGNAPILAVGDSTIQKVPAKRAAKAEKPVKSADATVKKTRTKRPTVTEETSEADIVY